MALDFRFYMFWQIKRYCWHIGFAAATCIALSFSVIEVAAISAALCSIHILLDLRSIAHFKSYELNTESGELKTVANLFQEFIAHKQNHKTAFSHSKRQDIVISLSEIINSDIGILQSSSNNLCGPIAFLNFLSKHNPELFVKTALEYFENGYTRAPFYLQSSFWDRWAFSRLLSVVYLIFPNHYYSCGEALAAAFKHTHNLLGYNNSCLLEAFKGSTKPLRIVQWLEQAGYACHERVTVCNFSSNGPIPWFSRLLLGGIYSQVHDESTIAQKGNPMIQLTTRSGSSFLNRVLNVGNGHWTYQPPYLNNGPRYINRIEISLTRPKASIL